MAHLTPALGSSKSTPIIGLPHTHQDMPQSGAPLGIDTVTREVVYFDPATLYPGYMSDRNIVVMGVIGQGKSSFVKTLLAALLAVPRPADAGGDQRRAWVIDRKREYTELARFFGTEPVYLGGGTRINILDPRLPRKRQLNLLLQITNLLLGKPTSEFQRDILTAAYERVKKRSAASESLASCEQPHVGQIVDELMVMRGTDYPESVGLDADTVHRAASDLFFALRRLTIGDLAGLFDGQTSPAFDPAEPLTVFQMEGDNPMQHQLVITILSCWMSGVWDQDLAYNKIDYLICDEVWEYLRDPTFASVIQSNFKLGRSKGLTNIILLHHKSDLSATGNSGTQQVVISENLVKDASTFVIFRMSEEDARSLQSLLELSDNEIDAIAHLEPHCALLVMHGSNGRRCTVFQHIILESDHALVDTDALGGW